MLALKDFLFFGLKSFWIYTADPRFVFKQFSCNISMIRHSVLPNELMTIALITTTTTTTIFIYI